MRGFSYVVSLFGTGAVVLYICFTVVAGISPHDAAVATVVIGVIAALLLVRAFRVDYQLHSEGGDPQLREAYNRQRERRGF